MTTVSPNVRIVPAGDSAMVVEFDERIDAEVNARCLSLAEAVRGLAIAGVRDVVPTYRSVTVYFDPLKTDQTRLVVHLRRASTTPISPAPGRRQPLRVPVCYGGEYGPDLSEVARFANATEGEAIALHASAIYRVFMLGFMPGFAYMGIVDSRIAAPRRAAPRTKVPAGSVGIARTQTGIYPWDTPGGWQLIGRTPLRVFDPGRVPPALFQAGDDVQFYPINRDEWHRFTS